MEGNVAQEMLRILSSHRAWSHGRLQAGPRRCLLGARLRADGVVHINTLDANLAHLNLDPYIRLLTRIICEQFPERIESAKLAPVQNIMSFNDWYSTCYADIRMVLEKAAASWEENHD